MALDNTQLILGGAQAAGGLAETIEKRQEANRPLSEVEKWHAATLMGMMEPEEAAIAAKSNMPFPTELEHMLQPGQMQLPGASSSAPPQVASQPLSTWDPTMPPPGEGLSAGGVKNAPSLGLSGLQAPAPMSAGLSAPPQPTRPQRPEIKTRKDYNALQGAYAQYEKSRPQYRPFKEEKALRELDLQNKQSLLSSKQAFEREIEGAKFDNRKKLMLMRLADTNRDLAMRYQIVLTQAQNARDMLNARMQFQASRDFAAMSAEQQKAYRDATLRAATQARGDALQAMSSIGRTADSDTLAQEIANDADGMLQEAIGSSSVPSAPVEAPVLPPLRPTVGQPPAQRAPAPAPAKAAAPAARRPTRTVNGETREWNGTKWVKPGSP